MPLNEKSIEVEWPASHYVFVRKLGSFSTTARACWQEYNDAEEAIKTEGFVSRFTLYKVKPEMEYMAGASLVSEPATALPEGVEYKLFEGGKYLQYTMTGSYSQLPVVVGQVFERVERENVSTRDGYFIEHYANDPKTHPEDELVTHILIPIN
jgi:predicted transcriptional regulator YdeE